MEALDHKCLSCGAKLPFNPETQKWDCQYCGKSFSLKELEEYEQKYSKKEESKVENKEVDLYNCPDCGAEIISDKNTTATFCVYCGNTSIIKNKLMGEFKPSKIIPFKNTKKEVMDQFLRFSKSRMFTPKEFIDVKNIEKITGVYIPFWVYDYDAEGTVNMRGNRVKTWRSGNYRYVKTDTYDLFRQGSMKYQKVPVDGSKKFDDNTMDSIEPFDYSKLEDFNMSYLSGFFSEKYDVPKEEAEQRAKQRVITSTEKQFMTTAASFSGVSMKSSNINYNNHFCEYVLLPVWMLNIKYNDKMHFFAMNGQSGKMVGNIPIDKKKVTLASILSFGIPFAIIVIIALILKFFA